MCKFSNILVSFIIPHKNIPDLLQRCVSSIPHREDVEIIIIDDNSDPTVVDFENFPFIDDKNVEVIFDKSGKRQGHARNIGIEKAKGEWIFFIDSDDFFFFSINQAIDNCKTSSADIIYYKSSNLDCESYLPGTLRSALTNESIDLYLFGDVWGENMIRYRHPVPWGKFIRRSLIERHNIRFPEIAKVEDFEFSYLCGHYANKIEAHNFAVYCVTTRLGNVTSTIIPKEALIIAKEEIGFLKFMLKNNLSNTPSFNIIEQDVFALIESLKLNQRDYMEGLKLLDSCGFSERHKKRMFNKIVRGRRNSKVLMILNEIIKKLSMNKIHLNY